MLKWRRTYTWQRYSNWTSCISTSSSDESWKYWRRLQLCHFVINCHLCLCLWLSKHRKGHTTTQTRTHSDSFTPTIALFSLSLGPSKAYGTTDCTQYAHIAWFLSHSCICSCADSLDQFECGAIWSSATIV